MPDIKQKIITIDAQAFFNFCSKRPGEEKERFKLYLENYSLRRYVVKQEDEREDCALFYQFCKEIESAWYDKEKQPFKLTDKILYDKLVIVDFGKIFQPLDKENAGAWKIENQKALLNDSKDLVENGFEMYYEGSGNPVHMVAFDKSGSMSRNSRISFIDEDFYEGLNTRLNLGMDFSKIPVIESKYYAYRGLYLSSSKRVKHPKFVINPDTIVIIKDVRTKKDNPEKPVTSYNYDKNIPLATTEIKVVKDADFREVLQCNFLKPQIKDFEYVNIPFDGSGFITPEYASYINKAWNGFLHHIHYQPKNEEAEIFVHAMRTKGNESVYSEFEKLMQESRCQQAAELLREKKGTSALLRNMDYIISRMNKEEGQRFCMEFPEDCSTLILLQLLFRYEGKQRKDGRIFKFTQHNLMKVHYETPEESEKGQSRLTEKQVKEVGKMIRSKLSEKLRNRLGKVYIEPSMKNYALPLAENTSQGGFGVLSKGSRIPIEEGKKLRAFTYWEKVNDIDLSVFALTEDGNRREFSWRTMSRHQSGAITYSGDETSGYLGGSEYFDINLPEFKARYSEYRYLIFCDNVYSGKNFNECFCKAGYMLRDWEDSGQVYEPKTVKSAYRINCESTFAYLFGMSCRYRRQQENHEKVRWMENPITLQREKNLKKW